MFGRGKNQNYKLECHIPYGDALEVFSPSVRVPVGTSETERPIGFSPSFKKHKIDESPVQIVNRLETKLSQHDCH